MNGTIPATVNSRDGSGLTSEALGTTVCPRSAKNRSQRCLISAVFMASVRRGCGPLVRRGVGSPARGRSALPGVRGGGALQQRPGLAGVHRADVDLQRHAQLVLALHEIGVEAALFPGSWSQWVRDPTRPVATGV